MLIAISGYGKMGKAVERIALERSHQVAVLDIRQHEILIPDKTASVIDFTNAEIAPSIIRTCIESGVPVVSGTTGWNAGLADMRAFCAQKKGAFLWAPNFSVGMYVTFAVNQYLAGMMGNLEEYDVRISETHHTAKKDAPSGTAIALAEQILGRLPRKSSWALQTGEDSSLADILQIRAERLAEVRGMHTISYEGPHDVISVTHEALSRDGFALGAVLAAEWIAGKQGAFGFEDVMADLTGLK